MGFRRPAVAPVKRGGLDHLTGRPPRKGTTLGGGAMFKWLARLFDVFEQALTAAMDDLTGDDDRP